MQHLTQWIKQFKVQQLRMDILTTSEGPTIRRFDLPYSHRSKEIQWAHHLFPHQCRYLAWLAEMR
jgi:hypothetical protein